MNDDSKSNGLVLLLILLLVIPLGALPVGAAILLMQEQQDKKGTCTGPNNGQAVTVANGGTLPTVLGFSPAQVSTAATILTVAGNLGLGEKAQLIGVITAMQETDLLADPTAAAPNGDGDAGPFQQRQYPGWYGSLDQVNDVTYAATAFYQGVTATTPGGYGSVGGGSGYGHIPGLVDIPGWEAKAPGDAAQAVQRSDFPGEYTKHIPDAQRLMSALAGVQVNVDYSGTGSCAEVAANGNASSAIERARTLLGMTYVYGATPTSPSSGGVDCSGLVLYAWGLDPSTLGRTAQNQFDSLAASPVPDSQLQPGDLLFYAYGRRGHGAGAIDHVGMYIGDGQMIEASQSAGTVRITSVRTSANDAGFIGARRIPPKSPAAPAA